MAFLFVFLCLHQFLYFYAQKPEMLFWKFVLWISCAIVFYNYAGYALIILVLNRFKKKEPVVPNEYFPSVSFIVAAYNEEDCIEKKVQNSLEQIYPANKIEFIFITDGSTDATPDIVQNYPSIRLLHSNDRKGKSAALNRAVESANNEILIFSDANTTLNKEACLYISKHYFDVLVGGVAGEKKVIALSGNDQNAASSEGIYWKYESVLKKLDSDFHTVVGAAGELFSVRRNLYEAVSPDVILDDFIISMKIAQAGYRIVYEPNAYAMELPSFSINDEKKRKVRISAGGFQAMTMLRDALFFWKHSKFSFLYISHRVLRWTLSPLCLILILLSSLILAILSVNPLYKIVLFAQVIFYSGALIYSLAPGLGKRFSLLKPAYYFSFMNISVFQGFFKFIRKKQSAAWEKAKRAEYTTPEIKNH
jgi:cellulose synthase/poly-beta-1,6-N-acetylglucosamine synthase-like glycosyltransferase